MAEHNAVILSEEQQVDDPNKPSGRIQFKIENFSAFELEKIGSMRRSDPVYIGGAPWNICAERREALRGPIGRSIGFFLECNRGDTDPDWRCACKAEMKVLAQKAGKEDFVRTVEHHVFRAEIDLEFFECGFDISFERLMNSANGFYDAMADTIVLAVDVTTVELVGINRNFVQNFAVLPIGGSKGKEFATKGKIKLEVPNLKTFMDGNASKKCNIGGFEWELRLERTAEGSYVVPIVCRPCRVGHLWLCRAEYDIVVLQGEYFASKYLLFTGDSFGQNCHHIPVKNGFPLRVKVDIKIYTELPSIVPLDTNIEVKCDDDRKSETIAVNKYSLAAVSSYFRNLFFVPQWREHGAEQFVIHENEFSISAFKFMLSAALSLGFALNEFRLKEGHYVELLKLAVKYDIPTLVHQCETRLIKMPNSPSYFKLLEVADAFSLAQLKAHCLSRVDFMEFGKNFAANLAHSSRLSKRTRDELDEKFKECVKQMERKRKRSDSIGPNPFEHGGE